MHCFKDMRCHEKEPNTKLQGVFAKCRNNYVSVTIFCNIKFKIKIFKERISWCSAHSPSMTKIFSDLKMSTAGNFLSILIGLKISPFIFLFYYHFTGILSIIYFKYLANLCYYPLFCNLTKWLAIIYHHNAGLNKYILSNNILLHA